MPNLLEIGCVDAVLKDSSNALYDNNAIKKNIQQNKIVIPLKKEKIRLTKLSKFFGKNSLIQHFSNVFYPFIASLLLNSYEYS